MDKFKDSGANTLVDVFSHICNSHPELVARAVDIRRKAISNMIWDFHGKKIAYGPFKGLRLVDRVHWGVADKGAMCLGLYENELLNELFKIKGQYRTFIDLGAADGYYGLGVLWGGIFEKSYCFELTDGGRSVIRENAILNGLENRVFVEAAAEKDFYSKIPVQDIENSVLFVDIEGAEFDVMDENTFSVFKNSIIFVELHDWFYNDGYEKLNSFVNSSKKTHTCLEIKTGQRNLVDFPEVHVLNDTDRWLICSEGRGRLMTWLKFSPIN